MNDKNLYIEQSAIEGSLLAELQPKTLNELQRLSGAVWTNFNAHDPGVTTSDVTNSALAELDYKLGFDLIDYLTLEQTRFAPEKYGMYLPEKVYPTTPVTLKDYRKLLLSSFPMLEDVTIELLKDGRYVIKAVPTTLKLGKNMQDFIGNIRDLYNANRNLCESLKEVQLCERTRLYLHSDIEIKSKEEATTVLAQVYWNILSYLSGGFYFEKYENLLNDELYWEELLEGPVVKKQLVFPRQENTMAELCGILSKIEGIKELKTCYLAKSSNDLKNIITDFKEGYSIDIPENAGGLKVRLRMGETEVTGYSFEEFIEKLKALYVLNRSSVGSDGNETELSRKFIPAGLYRNVYNYRNVAKDFPSCFKVSSSSSEANSNKQFLAYLKLFDLILLRGLKELNEVKNLLSITEEATVLSKLELITPSMGISNVSDKDKCRSTFELKNQYLDFLDHLYGVESNPEWIQWGKEVAEKEDDALKRRMNFLRKVPMFLQTRSKAWNINEDGSVPTIKEYISCLLGMGGDVVYVLENHWFQKSFLENPKESVSFVFSACSGRFSSEVFRNECMRFIRTLLPAHLTMRVYWLAQDKVEPFETAFKECMDAIKGGDPIKINSCGDKIKEILGTACGE